MSDPTTSGRSDEREEICAVCKIPAKIKCTSCKNVHYCSREHRESDWKSHSKNCPKIEMVKNDTLGRHYIATRKIEIDELLFCEKKPLLVAPNPKTAAICLSCYVLLQHDNAKPCDICGWPLCHNCTKHGPECELTMKYRKSKVIISNYSTPLPIYEAIIVLRALALRERNPKDYEKLLNHEDHCALTAKDKINGLIPMSFYDLANFVKSCMKIDDLNTTEVARIIGIGRVNAFDGGNDGNVHHIVLFDKASYISHSCRPNCRAVAIDDLKNQTTRVNVRSVATISKGDYLTITYVDLYFDTASRRRHLRATKFFDCTCERCKDPTEFGTMYSAVKCFEKKCTGYMLPSTFLVPRDKNIPDYVCDKCKLEATSAIIDEMMEETSTKFANIDQKNANQLITFINQQTKILHENHFKIMAAKIKLCASLFSDVYDNSRSVPEELVVELVTLCKQLYSLMEILVPSVYWDRGLVLYMQFKCMDVLCHIQSSRDPSVYSTSFEERKEVLTEAYRYLRHDPSSPADASKVEAVRLQLDDLNNIEKKIFGTV